MAAPDQPTPFFALTPPQGASSGVVPRGFGRGPLIAASREAMRTRRYSPRTERAYIGWIGRFLSQLRPGVPAHRADAVDASAFLTRLATEARVGRSTHSQAHSALLFLLREVLGRERPALGARPRRSARVPTVLTPQEVTAILEELPERQRLMAGLMYGSGLRVRECCLLRVADLDFAAESVHVRHGKGGKDRVTLMPASLVPALHQHLRRVRTQHLADLAAGVGDPPRPPGSAAATWGQQWLFPGTRLHLHAESGARLRHPIHPARLQEAFSLARRRAGIAKAATCHALRHSFATRLIEGGYNIRTVQDLLGHADVGTTLLYARTPHFTGARSPLDSIQVTPDQ